MYIYMYIYKYIHTLLIWLERRRINVMVFSVINNFILTFAILVIRACQLTTSVTIFGVYFQYSRVTSQNGFVSTAYH